MASPVNYVRDSISELRKVTWPTQRTVIFHTILVIVVSLFLMALLAALDIVLNAGFDGLWRIVTTA